jgi:hypothetical protein
VIVTSGSDAAVEADGEPDPDAAGADADGMLDAEGSADPGDGEALDAGLVAPGPQARATSMPAMSAASRTMPA